MVADVEWVPSAVSALDEFCLSSSKAENRKVTPSTRSRFLKTVKQHNLSSKQLDVLICSFSQVEIEVILDNYPDSDQEHLLLLMGRNYKLACNQLHELLSKEEFLLWLDENSNLDVPPAIFSPTRSRDKHPFPVVSSALDAFVLCNCRPQVDRNLNVGKHPRSEEVLAKLTDVVMDRSSLPSTESSREYGVFKYSLGISEENPESKTWALGKDGHRSEQLHQTDIAFTPSILFICSGIAVMIVLSSYADQLGFAFQARETLVALAKQLQTMDFVIQNMGMGMLNIAKCFDPTQTQILQAVDSATYAQQLIDWGPISFELQQFIQNSNLSSISEKNSSDSSPIDAEKLAHNISILLIEYLFSLIANQSMASPLVLSSLPKFGPIVSCLLNQYGSIEVQNAIQYAQNATNSIVDAASIPVPTTSENACR